MMVTIKAYQPYEGSGVLEVDGKLYFMDFPYSHEDQYPCSEEELEHLVSRLDFVRCELPMNSGAEAVEFLRAKGNEGESPFEDEDEATILSRYNSIGVVSLGKIIDAIIRLYVDTKQYSRALVGLNRFLELKVVKDNDDLFQKVFMAYKRCHDALEAIKAIKSREMRPAVMPGRPFKNLMAVR